MKAIKIVHIKMELRENKFLFFHYRELDDEISADVPDEVSFPQMNTGKF